MRTSQYIHDRKSIYAEQIVLECLERLAGVTDSKEEFAEGRRSGTLQLSKEGQKEWYLKNQDKGFEH